MKASFIALLAAALALCPGAAPCAEKETPDPVAASSSADEAPADSAVETFHTIAIDGESLNYTAVAGELRIETKKTEDKPVEGKIFYVAYRLDAPEAEERPVTFAFNGGPGAASVWLHMGGLGPRKVRLSEDGRTLPPPPRHDPNPFTWLTFTDLVFIDPVGTGFSRSRPDDGKQASKFYGVRQDIDAAAEFIRLYLTRNNRWLSPKYLAGESYGTTRAAGLTWRLNQDFGIDLNGVILISPVLDFDTILFHPSNDLPYLVFLPGYAATAWFHKRLAPPHQEMELTAFLAEVERFCVNRYSALLTKGDGLTADEKAELAETLSAYTGLDREFITRRHYRINLPEFTRNLLKKTDRFIGRMDGAIIGVDPDPAAPYSAFDPSMDGLFGTFSGAVNAYLRESLQFESDLVYEFLNHDVNRTWDWTSGLFSKQGFIDVSHTLKDAMALNQSLRIFMACGYYDLATPYFAARYTVDHMWLGDQKPRIDIRTYASGHMLYTRLDALKQFSLDVRSFYEKPSK